MLSELLKELAKVFAPLGVVWLALLAAALWGVRKRRWKWAVFHGALVLFMFLLGATSLGSRPLRSLEQPYAGLVLADLPKADAVMLLGGFVSASKYEVGGLRFNDSVNRLIMALELMRLEKTETLIVSGGGPVKLAGVKSESERMLEWLASWELPKGKVEGLARSGDTRDEAIKLKALMAERGWKRVFLVTSASHMRRASAVFRSQGVDIIPVACDFRTRASTIGDPELRLIPDLGGFADTRIYLRERIGFIVYRWRGWIQAETAD